MVGCPVSNRSHTIDRYLTSIYQLNFDKSIIHLAFLVNGTMSDDTGQKLEVFREQFGHEYLSFDIQYYKHDYIDKRTPERDYTRIADVRNRWINMRSENDEYIFSVDSDILVPEDTLLYLLSYEKDIVAASVKNYEDEKLVVYNFRGPVEDGLPILSPSGELIEVGMTGACYLINRIVLDRGVKYGYHEQGEDVYFCKLAREKGFRIFADTGIEAKHLME